jgi:hypothetical protein
VLDIAIQMYIVICLLWVNPKYKNPNSNIGIIDFLTWLN